MVKLIDYFMYNICLQLSVYNDNDPMTNVWLFSICLVTACTVDIGKHVQIIWKLKLMLHAAASLNWNCSKLPLVCHLSENCMLYRLMLGIKHSLNTSKTLLDPIKAPNLAAIMNCLRFSIFY